MLQPGPSDQILDVFSIDDAGQTLLAVAIVQGLAGARRECHLLVTTPQGESLQVPPGLQKLLIDIYYIYNVWLLLLRGMSMSNVSKTKRRHFEGRMPP